MMKSLVRYFSAGVLMAACFTVSAQIDLKNSHPDVYYVKSGDTLWDIASVFLESPWQWPELWHVNQQIDNPHLIYPGDVIRLEYVDGRPRLVVDRGQEARTVKLVPEKQQVETQTDNGIVKLQPKVREVPAGEAIPAISLDSVQSFLKEALVLDRQDAVGAPYVIGGQDGRVVFGMGDTIYGRDTATEWKDLYQNYGIYRIGEEYVDPDTREVLGYEVLQVGLARLAGHQKDVATFRVMRSMEDIRIEDRILSSRERKIRTNFYPSAPSVEIDARIIRIFGSLVSVARNDVVVINKGARDGLEEGNVLDILQAGKVVKDRVREEAVQLPSVRAGNMILFRVFDKVSFGLIMNSTLPISKEDLVTNPGLGSF